jgi:fatty-acid desaturase
MAPSRSSPRWLRRLFPGPPTKASLIVCVALQTLWMAVILSIVVPLGWTTNWLFFIIWNVVSVVLVQGLAWWVNR